MFDDKNTETAQAHESNKPRKAKTPSNISIKQFTHAQQEAQAEGFDVSFLNPAGTEPQLTEAVAKLGPAISASVAQGKQHGAAFLEKLRKASPEKIASLSDDDRKSIVDRHNWEASLHLKNSRPALKRGTGFASVSRAAAPEPAQVTEITAGRVTNAEQGVPTAKQDAGQPADPNPKEATNADELLFNVDPNKYGDDPEFAVTKFAAQRPDQPVFTWKRPDEDLANDFFRSIYREQPVNEIVSAAKALKADSGAMAKIRERGAEEAQYLDEAFRKLGLA